MKDNMRERKTITVLGDLSELEDKQKHEKGALNLCFSFYFNLLHTLIAVGMFSLIALCCLSKCSLIMSQSADRCGALCLGFCS